MSNNTVKFKHAKEGVISIGGNKTAFPDIWAIAGVDVSTIMNMSVNAITYDCPTDEKGLDDLIDKGLDFIENVDAANQAISMVMTESEKIDGIDVPELAWLQVGLHELSLKVHSSVNQMRSVLKINGTDQQS